MSSYFFGGGFTGHANSACKLRQSANPLAQQHMGPVQLGPIGAPAPQQAAPPPPPPPQQFTQQIRQLGVQQPRVLGVVPPAAPLPIEQPPAPPQQFVQSHGPMGPVSYPVMKKGEAPCPVCRG